jgi:protein-S-isoprenylcysteine O-methyltransferase Ste14
MWADPEMTVGRVLIASLWTAWICVGAVLEERDLVADFGDTYRKYQQRVPMLVPWRRPVPSAD